MSGTVKQWIRKDKWISSGKYAVVFVNCPFHQEVTPSMKIIAKPSAGWGEFQCLSCGKKGEVLRVDDGESFGHPYWEFRVGERPQVIEY